MEGWWEVGGRLVEGWWKVGGRLVEEVAVGWWTAVPQRHDFLIKHKETPTKHAPVYFKRRPRTFSGNQQNVQNIFAFALRFSRRKAWDCFYYESSPSNLRIMRKHKKIKNALPNMYYVLRIFLTEFCTNPLCPKTVAMFLQ